METEGTQYQSPGLYEEGAPSSRLRKAAIAAGIAVLIGAVALAGVNVANHDTRNAKPREQQQRGSNFYNELNCCRFGRRNYINNERV